MRALAGQARVRSERPPAGAGGFAGMMRRGQMRAVAGKCGGLKKLFISRNFDKMFTTLIMISP